MAQKSFKHNNPALSYFTEGAEHKAAAGSAPSTVALAEATLQQPRALKTAPKGAGSLQSVHPDEGSGGISALGSEPCYRVGEEGFDPPEGALEEYARNTRRTYPAKAPKHYETKSKRLNLLIQPSLAADIGKLATLYRISSNELIVRVLKEFTSRRREELKKYDRIFLQEE